MWCASHYVTCGRRQGAVSGPGERGQGMMHTWRQGHSAICQAAWGQGTRGGGQGDTANHPSPPPAPRLTGLLPRHP